MNESSTTATIFDFPSNDEKLINVPQESFKGEIPFEPEKSTKKSNWFSFNKHEKSKERKGQLTTNEIVITIEWFNNYNSLFRLNIPKILKKLQRNSRLELI